MNVFGAIAVTLLMAIVLTVGVVKLVAGSPLIILLTGAVFMFLFVKYGCLAH